MLFTLGSFSSKAVSSCFNFFFRIFALAFDRFWPALTRCFLPMAHSYPQERKKSDASHLLAARSEIHAALGFFADRPWLDKSGESIMHVKWENQWLICKRLYSFNRNSVRNRLYEIRLLGDALHMHILETMEGQVNKRSNRIYWERPVITYVQKWISYCIRSLGGMRHFQATGDIV